MNLSDVTAVFVQCCTLELARDLVEGLRRCYPDLKFVIVDNGSHDESTEYLRGLAEKEGFTIILNEDNWGHGPAMHQALRLARTRLCLVLDSDVRVLKCGFLELMIRCFNDDPKVYLLGSKTRKPRGAAYNARMARLRQLGLDNVHLCSSMIRRELYLTFSPFVYHGSPSMANQHEARRAGYGLDHFPIEQYLHHIGSGTLRVLGPFSQAGPIDPTTSQIRKPRRRGVRKRGIILGESSRCGASSE